MLPLAFRDLGAFWRDSAQRLRGGLYMAHH